MILIDRRTHGFLDYIASMILIFSPWFLDFFYGGVETWLPIILGFTFIFLGWITDFELGLVRLIPIKYHLGLDVVSGILLAIAPWIFGFSILVYLPHLIFGLLLIVLAFITDPVAVYKRDIAR